MDFYECSLCICEALHSWHVDKGSVALGTRRHTVQSVMQLSLATEDPLTLPLAKVACLLWSVPSRHRVFEA